MIKGTTEGDYLNIYNDPGLNQKRHSIQKFDEYYSWLLGPDNWKQKLPLFGELKKKYTRME